MRTRHFPFVRGAFFDLAWKNVSSSPVASPGHVHEYVTREEKAWAVLNKQALCRLCDSAEPTKWEQISQDSSESIRGFTQFFLLSTISCSHLMSSGFERFWHFGRNRSWHANKHARTHTVTQTCSACVNVCPSQSLMKTTSTGCYLLCGPCGSVWTWFCTNPLACPRSEEGKISCQYHTVSIWTCHMHVYLLITHCDEVCLPFFWSPVTSCFRLKGSKIKQEYVHVPFLVCHLCVDCLHPSPVTLQVLKWFVSLLSWTRVLLSVGQFTWAVLVWSRSDCCTWVSVAPETHVLMLLLI